MLFRLPHLEKLIAIFFTLLLASLCWLTLRRSDPTPHINDAYGKLPLQFEPNVGQAAADVEFLTRGSDYTLSLKQTEAVLSLKNGDVRLKLLDSNADTRISALDLLPGKVNHFIGNDPAKWRTDISTYKKVKYESVYPGIDLVYYGDQGRLEYDFVVAPRTDPQSIQLSFPDAKDLRIDQTGALIVKVQNVELQQPKPLIYQETATGRRIIDGNYILKDHESFTFQIGDYDRNEPLIIDPTLTYSTLLGTDTANSIAVDDAGNAYITGQINADVYVLKLNPSGTALVYATLIGGAQDDDGKALALDSGGNVYVTGSTLSTDFPTVNALQSTRGDTNNVDAFVFKLNSSGKALTYSTYLGGNDFDAGNSIAVNSSGNAFVTGSTGSMNFPIANALQPVNNSGDAFVSKFSPAGNTLVYSTYLGGNDFDTAFGIALDSQDNVYLTGSTFSHDFPTTSDARQPIAKGGHDAFLTKINSAGSALLYSSYHGGSTTDQATAITVHSDGSIYIIGLTFSADFPLVNALQSTPHFTNAFITKFDSTGKSIIYSTFLGGDGFDVPVDLTTDASGNLYVTGKTNSSNFPQVQPLQRSPAGFNATNSFVTKLNPGGSAVLFSTYLGSSIIDQGNSIAVRNGSIFVTGNTSGSRNFPITPGAFKQNDLAEDDHVEGFAFRIDSAPANYYSISGIVINRGLPMSNVVITLSGSTSRTIRTGFDGQYSFQVLAEGGTYTVTATPPPEFSFSPPGQTFANIHADQIVNFFVPRPPNDDFANAQVITDTSGVITGTTVGATVEINEMFGGDGSVWYRWQATTTRAVVLNYDPLKPGMVMDVFTGSAIGALTRVGTGFSGCDFGCSPFGVSFTAIAGTVYTIRLASTGGSPGNFGFSFSPGVTISGHVKNINGRSLPDLSVRVNRLDKPGIATTVTTDAGYSIIVPAGGSFSVVAVYSATGTNFVPVQFNNLNQDVTNVDFTTSSPTVAISGQIDSALGANVVVTVSGANFASRPCEVTNQGQLTMFFSCDSLPILGDYRIVPTTRDWIFEPLERFFPAIPGGINSVVFSARPRPPLRLAVEDPSPVPDLVVALDAALLLRDPFPLINPLNWLNTGADKNTRLIIFMQNFVPVLGEPPSEVVVNLNRSNQSFDVLAEDVRPLPNTDLTQVTFRLPDQLLPGDYLIRVRAHGETTSSATLRISP
jgi:Beta-propeller repeat